MAATQNRTKQKKVNGTEKNNNDNYKTKQIEVGSHVRLRENFRLCIDGIGLPDCIKNSELVVIRITPNNTVVLETLTGRKAGVVFLSDVILSN